MYVCMCMYVYIYIYMCMCMCIYIYIYIYICGLFVFPPSDIYRLFYSLLGIFSMFFVYFDSF